MASYTKKRQESELIVITKARDLCTYVMEVTQSAPKKFRFSYVNKMQNLSLSIIENCLRANELLFGGDHGTKNYNRRYDYQREAITEVKLLVYFAEMALRQDCILIRHYEQIAKLGSDCRNMLGAWINSDKKRLMPDEG